MEWSRVRQLWQRQGLDTKFRCGLHWAFFQTTAINLRAIHELGSVNTVLGIGTSDDLFWRDRSCRLSDSGKNCR
jgi:hypothetical protein